MQRLSLAALVAAVLACGGSDKEKFTATLDGASERPTPVTTTASGSATFTVNGANLDYTITATALSSNASAAHIHAPAAADAATGVYIGLTITAGGTSLTNSGTIAAADLASPKSMTELLKHIRDGNAYVNVHTSTNPSGEIRGQIKK